jgi:hypothetical protein
LIPFSFVRRSKRREGCIYLVIVSPRQRNFMKGRLPPFSGERVADIIEIMLASLENTARRLNSEVECDCATSIY